MDTTYTVACIVLMHILSHGAHILGLWLSHRHVMTEFRPAQKLSLVRAQEHQTLALEHVSLAHASTMSLSLDMLDIASPCMIPST
jgi:hypothetical protein